jgi:hypothetical protein
MPTFQSKIFKINPTFKLDQDYDDELEKENVKIQSEARELIQKTRRMMESLDAHKISNRESVNSSVVNSSINFFNSDLNEENPKPFDSTKFLKIEKDEMNKSINIS